MSSRFFRQSRADIRCTQGEDTDEKSWDIRNIKKRWDGQERERASVCRTNTHIFRHHLSGCKSTLDDMWCSCTLIYLVNTFSKAPNITLCKIGRIDSFPWCKAPDTFSSIRETGKNVSGGGGGLCWFWKFWKSNITVADTIHVAVSVDLSYKTAKIFLYPHLWIIDCADFQLYLDLQTLVRVCHVNLASFSHSPIHQILTGDIFL